MALAFSLLMTHIALTVVILRKQIPAILARKIKNVILRLGLTVKSFFMKKINVRRSL